MSCGCKKPRLLRIVEGWANVVWPDPRIEEIAKERACICNECDRVKKIGVYVCGECMCPLTAKLRSLAEECPLGKWKKEKLNVH